MGSTYVVGKRASACVDAQGRVFFLLSEQSYESNVYPRTPRWSTRFFGGYEAAMAYLIWVSGATEGGMLRGSATTAGAYIKQWRHELANPQRLLKERVSVPFGESLYKLPEASRDPINAILRKHSIAPMLGASFELDLSTDGAYVAIAEILAAKLEGVLPWRFFDAPCHAGEVVPGLGVEVPKQVKVDMPPVQVYRLGKFATGMDDDLVLARPDSIEMVGWSYSAMQSFIEEEAITSELKTPGSAEGLINRFRKSLADAPALPSGTLIKVKVDALNTWHQENLQKLIPFGTVGADGSVVVEVSGELQAEVVQALHYLPASSMEFTLGTEVSTCINQEQLELLAA